MSINKDCQLIWEKYNINEGLDSMDKDLQKVGTVPRDPTLKTGSGFGGPSGGFDPNIVIEVETADGVNIIKIDCASADHFRKNEENFKKCLIKSLNNDPTGENTFITIHYIK